MTTHRASAAFGRVGPTVSELNSDQKLIHHSAGRERRKKCIGRRSMCDNNFSAGSRPILPCPFTALLGSSAASEILFPPALLRYVRVP